MAPRFESVKLSAQPAFHTNDSGRAAVLTSFSTRRAPDRSVSARSFAVRFSDQKRNRSRGRSEPHSPAQIGSKEAREEIQAYIAIRDLLLSSAETAITTESLRRATIANEFVETCLRPPRSPYEAQSLEQRPAARELERCCAAKIRIATLKQKLSQGFTNP
jgi:hypothetical protein